ncbi:MAG: ComEC/Rec2 family competence protein [Clostridium perfringens]|nr:ComEC/Rec2 family competence protein [Clostridium perfringens]
MLYLKNTPKLLIKKPLVFIAISVIIGNLTYLIINKSLIGVIIFIASIIFLSRILIDKNFLLILIAFFIVSFLSSLLYYSINNDKNSIYTVKIYKVSNSETVGLFRGRKVYINNLSKNIKTGNIVTFKGKFKKKLDFENGTIGYMFIKNEIESKKSYNYYTNRLGEKYFKKIKDLLGESKSALVTALVFGNKDFLSYSQKNNLSNLGVIHLICISGLHLSLLFTYINKVLNSKLALFICGVYIILIGCPISAVRAFMMTFLMISSKKFFKTYDSVSALCLAAIILIFYRPYTLYESGFVLSFLATLGIILFYKNFSKAFYILPSYINNFLSITLAAQVFIYPYMIFKFNTFSMNFLLGGFLLTPIISIMLPLGFLTIIFLFSIKILSVICILMNILFLVLNGILIFLNKIALESVFVHNLYGFFYLGMFICIYMSYKGFKGFNIIFYSMYPMIILFSLYMQRTML